MLYESSAGNPAPYPYILTPSPPETPGNWIKVGCDWNPSFIDVFYNTSDTFHRYTKEKIYVEQLTAMPFIIDSYTPAFQYCIPFIQGTTQMPFNYDLDYIKKYGKFVRIVLRKHSLQRIPAVILVLYGKI
ncbi:MAG: hypothetical protein IPM92_00110 [Saprospiraceae bacterium]|nr:hypothetical protein [Saprospiraceae bacterium]